MNFALLGCSPAVWRLVEAIAKTGDHRVVWARDVTGVEQTLRAWFPEVTVRHPAIRPAASPDDSLWEELAARDDVDAVVVARSGRSLDEPLRRLARAGKHLLFEVAGPDVPFVYYELAMIGEETCKVFVPLVAERLHPAFTKLRTQLLAADQGRLRQIHFQRCADPPSARSDLPAASASAVPGSSHTGRSPRGSEAEAVPVLLLEQFASDIDLLRYLAGEFSRVSAVCNRPNTLDTTSVSAAAPGFRHDEEVCVNLTSADGAMVSWIGTVGGTANVVANAPAATTGGHHLRVVTEKAEATLAWIDLEFGCRLKIQTAEGDSTQEFGPWQSGRALFEAFLAGVESGRPQPDLNDAIRNLELAEATGRALRRRKVVDVVHGEPSEVSTFKGLMSSVGCGLLLATLPLLLVTGVAGWLGIGWLVALVRYAWYVVLALTLGFLGLQLFGFLFPSAEK